MKKLLFLLLFLPVLATGQDSTFAADTTAIILDSLKEVKQEVAQVQDSIKAQNDPIMYSTPEDGTTTIPEPVGNVTIVAIVLIAIIQLRQVILNLVKNIKYLNTTVPGILVGLGALYAQTVANNGWQNLSWENFVISGLIGLLGGIQSDVDWKGIFTWLIQLIKKPKISA